MNIETKKPSKQFIKRGTVAILIVAILLSVQTPWFKDIFNKNETSLVGNQTVGEIVTKDTNGNGISDWEEKLWGLDPSVLYTDGKPNKTIIEEKKMALGINNTQVEPKNETDRIAREIFTLATALGQSGEVSDESMQQIASKMSETISGNQIYNSYSTKDIQTIKTSYQSLNTYHSQVSSIVDKYQNSYADIDVLINAIESGDYSKIGKLSDSAETYRKISKELIAVRVPLGVANYHLNIANSIAGIADSFEYIVELEDNGLMSIVGVAVYKSYSTKLAVALIDMEDYMIEYGIIQ